MFETLGYDLFCEIVSEPTTLSGAGRYSGREITVAFTKKFGRVPSPQQLHLWEKMYQEEQEYNKMRLGEAVSEWSHSYYRSPVSRFEYENALYAFD